MSLFSKERILVPIDFSDASFRALENTLEFAGNPEHVHVLHVLHHLEPTDPAVIWQTIDDDTRKQRVKESFFKRCSDRQYQNVHFVTEIGDPSSEILDYAKLNDINLIVIPSHGRTGIGRFFLGSVAEKVIRFAHCPVLVLRREGTP